ncbi:MAG: membrane dipeptidase, partial [Clostridia bacterium]|nr:membrane dipeptidase [Clostridia bacterium]
MPIFDLHADSLVSAYENGYSLKDCPLLQVNLDKIIKEKYFCQCFAIFVNDNTKNPFNYYKKIVDYYNQYIKVNKINNVSKSGVFKKYKTNTVLTVENARVIGDDLSKIDVLKNDGVKMVTLVWNNENNLAYSHKDGEKGLKPFGFECVEKFNKSGIIVDLSHISKKGFNDVCKYSKKPVVASHSNCQSICNNSRNLSDENLKLLANTGGVVGINFYPPFI